MRNELTDLANERAVTRKPATVELDSCGRTDRGTVREENEDHFLVAEMWRVFTIEQSTLPGALDRHGETDRLGYLFAIADGMGGHVGGELASRRALEAVEEHLLAELGNADDVSFALQSVVRRCERRVLDLEADDEVGRPPGTTLTLALIVGRRVYIAHVGDSRAYLVRAGRPVQLTSDHTLGEWLRREGLAEAETSSQFESVLVNAIGGGSERAIVDTTDFELLPGDSLLLCSDGLTRSISEDEIASVVASSASASECCDRMLAIALERDGRDNITVVVARHAG